MLQASHDLPGRLLCALLLVATPVACLANETLDTLLQRLHINETLQYRYQETRQLQLLAEPWQASGELFISPQQMVIAQHAPTSVTTLITADRLVHHDDEQAIHRRIKLERPFAVPGMEPFMQLLFGSANRDELQRQYRIDLTFTDGRWHLQLEPRATAAGDITAMLLAGNKDRMADRLVLTHADGDQTSWQLTLLARGVSAERALQAMASLHQRP